MITALVLLAGLALVLLVRLLVIANRLTLPEVGKVLPLAAGAILALGRWLLLALAFGYAGLLVLYPFFQ